MNSKYENDTSKAMSLEDLVKLNGAAMTAMDEVQYQPIIYAVPKGWVESGKLLLENATQFQPTLYQKIELLATQKGLQDQQVHLRADLEMVKREMLKELEDLKKQDGSLKKKLSSALSDELSTALQKIRDEYSKQQKENLRFMVITIASSAVLSALVSGLFLLLGG